MKYRRTDKQILDFLQSITDKAVYTGKVILRWSSLGRGWRLHETTSEEAVTDVRKAIIAQMPMISESTPLKELQKRIWREIGEEMQEGELDKEILHEWYCHSCDFQLYMNKDKDPHLPCPYCGQDFEMYVRTTNYVVMEEGEYLELKKNAPSYELDDLKQKLAARLKELQTMQNSNERKNKTIREVRRQANCRICSSCLTNHPIGTSCPPREARSSRPREQHLHEQLQEKDQTIEQLQSIISKQTEELGRAREEKVNFIMKMIQKIERYEELLSGISERLRSLEKKQASETGE
jgi:rubrerythrin